MRRRFGRSLGKRPYKRMFVIVAEGTVSEFEYFQLLNGWGDCTCEMHTQ